MSSSYMSPHVGATSVASTHTEHSPSLLFHALLMSLGGTCLSNFWLGRTTSQSYLDYSATPRSPGHAPRPSSLAAEASVSVPASAKKRRKSSRCFESLRIHRVCATHPWAPEAWPQWCVVRRGGRKRLVWDLGLGCPTQLLHSCVALPRGPPGGSDPPERFDFHMKKRDENDARVHLLHPATLRWVLLLWIVSIGLISSYINLN